MILALSVFDPNALFGVAGTVIALILGFFAIRSNVYSNLKEEAASERALKDLALADRDKERALAVERSESITRLEGRLLELQAVIDTLGGKSVVAALEDQYRRAEERHERLAERLDERDRRLLGLIETVGVTVAEAVGRMPGGEVETPGRKESHKTRSS